MSKHILLLTFLATILLVNACKDDAASTGDVSLNFTATVGEEPMVLLSETYTYPDGSPLKMQLLNYFVSDVTLLKAIGSEEGAEMIMEIDLVAHENDYDEATALAGVTFNLSDIPVGEYAGIRLGLGVAPRLNATQPGNYAPGHPLAENYWSPATGYIFAKIEGNADQDGDGEFETGLTYHTGADPLYEALTFEKAITVSEDQNTTISFNMDLEKILTDADGNYLDISDAGLTIDHSVKPEVYEFLWANWLRALSVK